MGENWSLATSSIGAKRGGTQKYLGRIWKFPYIIVMFDVKFRKLYLNEVKITSNLSMFKLFSGIFSLFIDLETTIMELLTESF